MKHLLILVLLVSSQLFSQERNCGSNLLLKEYLTNNSSALEMRSKLEKKTSLYQSDKSITTTIPVVVHVVYKNNTENISNAQIESQIRVLNEDFTRSNADAFNTPTDFLPIVANAQINFCLAKQDPNGNPTNGIIRKQTLRNSFELYGTKIYFDSLGGSNAWNTEKYLNIWVCEIDSGVLGWAQFPAGGNPKTDGVVINYEHFGTTGTAQHPYDLGRTTTHEVGHWLNLIHIWGDNTCGNDYVNDTPEQETANFGCKVHPYYSCSNNGDMFMNFMDYTNDACMNSFTEGQKNRMWSAISNWRTGLLSSNACTPSPISNSDAGIIDILEPNNQNINCASPIYPKVVLKNYGNSPLYTATIKYNINNNNYHYFSWNGYLQANETDTIDLSAIGGIGNTHILEVSSFNPNNSSDTNPSNDKKTIIFSSINGEQVLLNFTTDNYANETSWQLLDDANNIIDSGDSLMNNKLYQNFYCLDYGCYTFVINDSYGDGFCCNFGNGNFTITSTLGNHQYAHSKPFTFTDTTYFCIGETSVNEIDEAFIIYPNPSDGNLWLKQNLESNNTPIFAKIFNSLGQQILTTEVNNNKLDITQLNNGVYQLRIETKNKQIITQIIIQK